MGDNSLLIKWFCIKRLLLFAILLLVAFPLLTSAADNTSPQKINSSSDTAEYINVWYATLRNINGKKMSSEHYGGMRDKLRTGICRTFFSPIWGLKDIADAAPFYIPDLSIELKGVSELPVNHFLDEIDAFKKNNEGNIVFYIHGYNIGFKKSCKRAALFQRALNRKDRLILFSWPADGNFLKYTWDEADLIWSVPYIESFLHEIVDRMGSERVNVVAHSLGARGVLKALFRMSLKKPSTTFLNELILVAPDVDADIFRNELPQLRNTTKRITLYVSEKDKALKASQEVHGYPRLGEAGENLTVLEGVETIDISPARNRRFSGHVYHLYNPAVVADLARLLETGESAGQRPGLIPAEIRGILYWRLETKEPE